MRIPFLALAATAALALSHAGAQAQTSEADLLKKFETHQQTHRGLSLSPVTAAGATAAGQAATSSAGAQTEAAPRVRPEPGSSAAAPQVEYVRMPADAQINVLIQFDYNSAALRPTEFDKLTMLCNAMRASDVKLFRIFGHTDASGSNGYNLRLSKRRADSVRQHLVVNCGIAPERLQAIGVGEDYPLITSNPNAAENRRVEFQAIG